jgi:putative ABC transport system substrate-binding protein
MGESRNLVIDECWTTDDMTRVRSGADKVLNLKPDAILVAGRRAVAALQERTRVVPVVFAAIGDPVESGLVASLAHPGGNFTGFTLYDSSSIMGKLLEMLKQMAPSVTHVGLIYNPDNPGTVVLARSFETAAPALGIRAKLAPIHSTGEIERIIESIAREPNGGLVFPADVTVFIHRDFINRLVARHRLPAIYSDPALVASGGLMFFGTDRIDLFRRAAGYVDRILRGEKPSDLPVETPTKYQLVINLKTAKALGVTIPDKMLALADEVIE